MTAGPTTNEPAAGGRLRRFFEGIPPRLTIARKEFRGLFQDKPRHQRLHGRLMGILIVSLVLDLVVTVVLFLFDPFSDTDPYRTLSSFGRAFTWTSSQMLVDGSSYVTQTPLGHVSEVGLQAYGVTVIAALAGSFTSFFLSADNPPPSDNASAENT